MTEPFSVDYDDTAAPAHRRSSCLNSLFTSTSTSSLAKLATMRDHPPVIAANTVDSSNKSVRTQILLTVEDGRDKTPSRDEGLGISLERNENSQEE